ncbi:MAG TPA: stress response translation initiation inhibitor YciH [Chloroflexota bacterium]|jgi:translation initiation factor 1|nr:stress response translation initiation inhibitor YciH [Chloroflexota bacterium]
MSDYSRLVYSTDGGRQNSCPSCGRKYDKCVCGRPPRAPAPRGTQLPSAPHDGIVRVWRDRGGRRGKTVTIVTGVPANRQTEIVSALKRAAAAGGVLRGGAIEIQGDHRDLVAARLGDLGFRVKLAGG